jgi:preprotein translocase subunit YajC
LESAALDIFDLVAPALAQATSPATQPAGGTSPPPAFQFLFSYGPLILIFVLFYFLFIRSKQTTERTRQQMLSALKKGDEVQTIGGVLGKVIETRDDRVLLKVDESSNAKMWFTRGAIQRVITQEKTP